MGIDMDWADELNDMFAYHKKYKNTSVLHYEYADEEEGIIPSVEITTDILGNDLGDIVNWCKENIKGEWFWDIGDKKGGEKDTIFYFEKRIDATTFRLTWG